jgi:hypothetical protein
LAGSLLIKKELTGIPRLYLRALDLDRVRNNHKGTNRITKVIFQDFYSFTGCITTEKELTGMQRFHLRAVNLNNYRNNQKEETRKPKVHLRVLYPDSLHKTERN